jgi:beta-xylosidase
MIEPVMLWNEPNNLSHGDFEIDEGRITFSPIARAASDAIHAERPRLTRVFGGISPIDPSFLRTLDERGVLDAVDVVAVHGFPLDWNHWQIDEWPAKLAEIRAVTRHPVWNTEVGASSFGAEEVQDIGLARSAEILAGLASRVHWYSLFDLPKTWPATTRHREAEGGRATTANSTWASFARTAHPSARREGSRASRARSRTVSRIPANEVQATRRGATRTLLEWWWACTRASCVWRLIPATRRPARVS